MRENRLLCKMRCRGEMCIGGCRIISGAHMHKFNTPRSSAVMRQSLAIA